MKKYILSIIICLLSCPQINAGRSSGGAIAAGALGGLAVGTMIGAASAGQSRSISRAEQKAVRAEQDALRARERAEQEALRAQEKVEQIRVEQGQQRIAALEREIERRNIENKIAKSHAASSNNLYMLLISLVIVLLGAAIGLAVLVIKKKS